MNKYCGIYTGMEYTSPMRGVCYGPLVAATSMMAKVAMVGGTLLSSAGAVQAGNAQKSASEFQAKQLKAAGLAEDAAAQRKAEESTRQAEIMQSRARAVGAASGGGVDVALAGDIEAEGEYRSLLSLWEGAEAAKGRNAQASAAQFEGSQAKKAGVLKAGSTLLKGGTSFYEKYY